MEINGYNAIKDIEAIVMQDKTSVQPNETFKLILIGSAGVGKSSLILRATTGKFSTEHNATIGVEFGSVLVKVGAETPAGEKLVRLQTWDTGGMESFRSLTRIFYKGAQVVFVVYDVSNLKSFTAIGEWLEEAKQYAGNEVKVFLIANKCDLSDKYDLSLSIGWCRRKWQWNSRRSTDCWATLRPQPNRDRTCRT
eukprot:TRINITY_DN9262_c0_g1_i2.p2 TRINITY_DN9262_c0_g1~~TRINITY_DN9262_c0_g1_i2.p2  ORF type:complete len:195 (+),score=59.97 TRINITY_DN9262_c0_g1_i2:158-742(+)